MYYIRQAHFSDIPSIYEICLKTGASGKDASSLYNNPYLLGDYYAVNYLAFEPEACFVVSQNIDSEKDLALGYILGCANSINFNLWMEETWLPSLRKKYPLTTHAKTETEKKLVEKIHINHTTATLASLKEYPAHLHIDILPVLQGSGYGSRLIETFESYLKEKIVQGVHLGVDGQNQSAIAFYKKAGYEVLEEQDWGLLMGKKIV